MDDATRNKIIATCHENVEQTMMLLKQLLDGIPTTSRTILEVQKYISTSGNETWRCYCEDGTIVYFRQAMKEFLKEMDIWDYLNKMEVGDHNNVNWEIETIPDGAFFRVVNVIVLPNEDL